VVENHKFAEATNFSIEFLWLPWFFHKCRIFASKFTTFAH